MAIAGFSAVPNRNTSRTELVNTTNTFFSEVAQFVTDANALADDVNTGAETASTKASEAEASADAAAAAADAASLASNATMWISGGSYVLGQLVWSPIDYKTYRAITAHNSETTDPSADATNWLSLEVAIADDAITNAKLANMATARIKGRVTAGTGDPEDLTAAQVKAMLGVGSTTLAGARERRHANPRPVRDAVSDHAGNQDGPAGKQ
ncbi:hypothetical protein JQW29_18995 [Sulfitobacter pseudonitzschiae]|uniref:hypothetical protein n=1 Tax=Pseudosulfitobacter pseudonitzschiae TaxID=1402135 RepID=UPI001D95FC01|nr:hypothetical protein [Pseudosulfitobacter pseudonitzschiae]MBM1897203.1 hypothetical protein [Pseudosulfitobacter pseudonitzschiae]MBM1901868.1 hypothetical protein [Pseudosulfitobacter pseudonitzschiae]MBM1906911.1 hypothetical protein [Pseudosulfitobacter pseudonitzschiae]MBM1940775.1 hypothetical protein [Pseudosulfitobacter pseudonitzschiae]MBM1950470.1 hypothetical protein [Pseudosulfitobacter pseudonitzschiae]